MNSGHFNLFSTMELRFVSLFLHIAGIGDQEIQVTFSPVNLVWIDVLSSFLDDWQSFHTHLRAQTPYLLQFFHFLRRSYVCCAAEIDSYAMTSHLCSFWPRPLITFSSIVNSQDETLIGVYEHVELVGIVCLFSICFPPTPDHTLPLTQIPFVWQPSGEITAFFTILLAVITLFTPYNLDYVAWFTFDGHDALRSVHFLCMSMISTPFLMLPCSLSRRLLTSVEPVLPF